MLKKYGNMYKLQVVKCVRNKGVTNNNYSPKNSKNEDKLDCNIRRAKNKVREYVLCNEFDYFITLTLDKEKYNRYDLHKYSKDLSHYIRNLRTKYKCDIEYILIPEQHKDGAWHIHGFIKGLPGVQLKDFKQTDKIPKYIKEKLICGHRVLKWIGYEDKFGFCDLEPIKDKEKASSYVTKYITKDMDRTVKEIGAKLYYSSRGLKTSKEIKRGQVTCDYRPSYTKFDDFGNVLYSEQILRGYTLEQAKSLVYNYISDTLWESIVDEDGVLTCDMPLEWI